MPARGRIVIVDDDKAFSESISMVLEDAGYLALEAPSAAKALDLVDRVEPGLVLVDISNPVEEGYRLISELHRRAAVRPLGVVAMSSVVQAGRSPTRWFLDKPVRRELLLAIVSELCGNRVVTPFWSWSPLLANARP